MFTVAETKLFTRIVESYLTEEEYGVLQMKLAADPDQGINAKNEAENVCSQVLRKIREEVDG